MLFWILATASAEQALIVSEIYAQLHPQVPAAYIGIGLPLTFAHPFALGDVPAGTHVLVREANAEQAIAANASFVCLRVHDDGSCRHGMLSTPLPPNFYASSTARVALELVRVTAPAASAKARNDALLRLAALDVRAVATFTDAASGDVFEADLLQAIVTDGAVRLAASTMVEMTARVRPARRSDGAAHAQLDVDVVLRVFFGGSDVVHVDVAVENARTNISTALVSYPPRIDSTTRYAATVVVSSPLTGALEPFVVGNVSHPLTHVFGTRWRMQRYWPLLMATTIGDQGATLDDVHFLTHNVRYLERCRAVPPIDYVSRPAPTNAEVQVAASGLLARSLAPLQNGVLTSFAGTTGDRDDIGPLTEHAFRYLFRPDSWWLWKIVLSCGDLSGSFPLHWRNASTAHALDSFVSIRSDPLVSTIERNRAHQVLQDLTPPRDPLGNVMTVDLQHQPSLAFLPYLLTGAKYYADELVFWPTWSLAHTNHGSLSPPAYRQRHKGVIKDTERGLAWCYRNALHASLYLPSSHPMLDEVSSYVTNSLEWWTINAPPLNPLGYFALDVCESRYASSMQSDVKLHSTPNYHDFLVFVLQMHAAFDEATTTAPTASLLSSNLLTLRNYMANWTINRFHKRNAASWDISYGDLYQAACYSNNMNDYYQTMAQIWNNTWKPPQAKDGLGSAGRVNPTRDGSQRAYIARATLKLLAASDGTNDDVATPLAELTRNLPASYARYKWAIADRYPDAAPPSSPSPSPSPTMALSAPPVDATTTAMSTSDAADLVPTAPNVDVVLVYVLLALAALACVAAATCACVCIHRRRHSHVATMRHVSAYGRSSSRAVTSRGSSAASSGGASRRSVTTFRTSQMTNAASSTAAATTATTVTTMMRRSSHAARASRYVSAMPPGPPVSSWQAMAASRPLPPTPPAQPFVQQFR